MRKRNMLGSIMAAAAIGLFAATPANAKEVVIPEGIFIGDLSLGGITKAQADEKIQEYIDHLSEQTVVLDIDGQTVNTTSKELGLAWSNPDAVEEAEAMASRGNLVQRYMTLMDLKKEPLHIPLEVAVDEERVGAFVQAQANQLTAEPQNAVIARVDGNFVITPEMAGRTVDTAETKKALEEALSNANGDTVAVKAAVVKKEPDITEEMLSSIGDVLGTFSTDFSSSGAARSKNLANGAGKINGRVLMPGETLSGYECMHPFTTSNGYYTAASYENGQVVDSVGGGVCQIATTLYNAALQAELEISQRQNHSMVVAYVKPSMDAAIAGTYKDIKITNNYSTPIYVEGGVSGRTLTFTIYGKETRSANRKVEYVSETLKVTDPGAPTERVDHSLAPGARKKVQSSHRGLKSRLWKVVTVDGVETERTLLHTDTYNPSKAIVLVGPSAKTAEAAEDPAARPEETQISVVEGIGGGADAAVSDPTEAPIVAEKEVSPTVPAVAENQVPAEAPSAAPAAVEKEAPSAAPAGVENGAPTAAPWAPDRGVSQEGPGARVEEPGV